MEYSSEYDSPLGKIFLSADEIGLTGAWFEDQKHFPEKLPERKEIPIFKKVKNWLDVYFNGIEPDIEIPIHFIGTDFQKEVWKILCGISYGKTVTYGEIARIIAGKRDVSRISAQAVGGAVGHNRISVIVPCHRVIGADGRLTGYAGGLDRKRELLKLENVITKSG